ncbi:MAG: hypothetical protein KGJ78_11490 [Alphaproteobacteria bacterium]|nr:hypothetical protein [Alphaproteobacteria bacterium]
MTEQPPLSRTALTLVGALMLAPVLLFAMPPVLDFPNHVTRLWLLTGGMAPPLNRFYGEDWSGIGTNIGIDVLAKLFVPLMPAFTLGRVLLALAVVLPPLGAMVLNIATFHRREPWLSVFAYFAFSETLLAGFLNFQIGLGLALLAAAADMSIAKVWARCIFRLAAASVVFIFHPFALMFYALLLGGILIGATLPTRREVRSLAQRLAEAAAICAVPVVAFLAKRALPGDPRLHFVALFNDPLEAVGALLSPFASYNAIVDLAFAYPLVLLVGYAAATRRIEAHAGLLAVAAGLALVSLVMPRITNEAGWMDRRLPIMAVLTALAATQVSLGASRRMLLTVGTMTFVALRTAWITWNWSAGDAMLDSIRAATAALPAGAAVLPVQQEPDRHDRLFPPPGRLLGLSSYPYAHYPALLVAWHHAFVPSLFAELGKQPVKVRAPYDRIAVPQGGDIPSIAALMHVRDLEPAYRGWRRDFGYVLVLNADRPRPAAMLPHELLLVRDAGFAKLYRVRKPDRRN